MSVSISGRPVSRVRDLSGHSNHFNLAEFGLDPSLSDNASAMSTLIASVPASSLIECPPGRYKFLSESAFNEAPSMKFVALSGKHYQGNGTTAAPITSGGVIFEGWTANQTVFSVTKSTLADATHQGPTFEGIGFQDGRYVASRRTVTGVALSSGTVYTYTVNTTGLGNHTFVAGDSIYVNGIAAASAPLGTAFNGRFTVAASPAPTGSTFSVDIGSNPSTSGLVYSNSDVHYQPSMTLLKIVKTTRARFRDCEFMGGKYGLYLDPNGGDVSWSNVYGCTFHHNDFGIYGAGGAAQSIAVNGGDFQVAHGQTGIRFTTGNTAMVKIRDFKMDTLYNDGTGATFIELDTPASYVIDGTFEQDGPSVAIRIGTTGSANGRIFGGFQANNQGAKTTRNAIGIELGANDTNATGATTNTSTTVSLATININDPHTYFKAGKDEGKTITGTNIPAATTISSVTDTTHAVLSAAATGTGSSLTFTWNWGLGTDTTNVAVSETTIMGSTFNGYKQCVVVGGSARGAKVIGGSMALCDTGVNVQAGAQGTILAFFTRRRKESGSDTTASTFIIDNGTDTRRIFCDGVGVDGGLVPGAGAQAMTDGFIYIPSGSGAPSGTPTTFTGVVPMYFDATNHKLYIYDTTWKTYGTAMA